MPYLAIDTERIELNTNSHYIVFHSEVSNRLDFIPANEKYTLTYFLENESNIQEEEKTIIDILLNFFYGYKSETENILKETFSRLEDKVNSELREKWQGIISNDLKKSCEPKSRTLKEFLSFLSPLAKFKTFIRGKEIWFEFETLSIYFNYYISLGYISPNSEIFIYDEIDRNRGTKK